MLSLFFFRSSFFFSVFCIAFLNAGDGDKPKDDLVKNMSPNREVYLEDIKFEVFRQPFSPPNKPLSFNMNKYKVRVGSDGLLYAQRSTDGKEVLLSSMISSHAAQFVVDTQGDFYVFHNTTDNLDYDKAFLSGLPDLIASGSIVVSEGKILALTPHTASGVPTEESLIKFMNLLRIKGYDEYPLVLRDGDAAFSMVLQDYKENGFRRDYYSYFLKTFKKHLESVDLHLIQRQGDCRASLLRGYKSKILRI